MVSFQHYTFRRDFGQGFPFVEINIQLSIAVYIQRLFLKKQLRFENYSKTTLSIFSKNKLDESSYEIFSIHSVVINTYWVENCPIIKHLRLLVTIFLWWENPKDLFLFFVFVIQLRKVAYAPIEYDCILLISIYLKKIDLIGLTIWFQFFIDITFIYS